MNQLFEIIPPEAMAEMTGMMEKLMSNFQRQSLWGYNLGPGISPDSVKYAYEKWTPRKTDVFLAAYPKTGTNFGMEVLRGILYQDEKLQEITKMLPPPFFIMDFGSEKKFSLVDNMKLDRRLHVTHLPAELINIKKIQEVGAKVIYVLRNPKDQMVSLMKFSQKMPFGQVEPMKSMVNSGWDEYFEHVVKGEFAMNTKPGEWYPEHILSWYKHKDEKTVKFVYFEDLKNDPEGEIKKIADFLEIPITDAKIKEIATETSFDKMKQNSEKLSNQAVKTFRQINMRKGAVGGWKDYFTVSQSERVDAIFEENLKDTDIKFNDCN